MQLTRLDKNVAHNFADINRHYENESSRYLIKRLIGYFSWAFHYRQHNQDIFGAFSLEAAQVSSVFGYSPRSLKNTHPDPAQLRHHAQDREEIISRDRLARTTLKEGEPAWLNELDNALYLLFYYPAPYTKGKVIEGSAYSMLKENRVLASVSKHYINKTGKCVYQYTLDEGFIRNTASYFFFFDFTLFRKLTEKEMDVYLSLLHLKTMEIYNFQKKFLSAPKDVVLNTDNTIDYLAHKWSLPVPDNVNPFSHWKKRINNLLDDINQKAGYTFAVIRWEKARGTDRFEGKPVIAFPIDNPVEQAQLTDNIYERMRLYSIYFLKDRFRQYNSRPFVSMPDFRQKFMEYLYNENLDIMGKKEVVAMVYELIYRKPLDVQWVSRQLSYLKTYAAEMYHEKEVPLEVI